MYSKAENIKKKFDLDFSFSNASYNLLYTKSIKVNYKPVKNQFVFCSFFNFIKATFNPKVKKSTKILFSSIFILDISSL